MAISSLGMFTQINTSDSSSEKKSFPYILQFAKISRTCRPAEQEGKLGKKLKIGMVHCILE